MGGQPRSSVPTPMQLTKDNLKVCVKVMLQQVGRGRE